MSNTALTWAYNEVRGVGLAAKAVLVRLADQANDDGVAWPGKNSLAEKLDCDKRTVDRAIAKLEALGLVRIKVGVPKDARTKTERNIYYLQMEQRGLFGPEIVTEPAAGADPAGAGDAAKGVAERQGWQSARGGPVPPKGVAESRAGGGAVPSEPPVNHQGIQNNGGPPSGDPPSVYLTAKGKKLSGAALHRFERWWEAFGRYGNKAPTADTWLTVERLHKGHAAGWDLPLLAAARAECKRRQADPSAPAKYGQGWLAERRWEDASSQGGQPRAGSAPPAWWQTWPGVLEVACGRYGILTIEFSEPPALLAELIERMTAAGDAVPDHLHNWLKSLKEAA